MTETGTHHFVLASRNAHKLREFERLLPDTYRLQPLPDGVHLPPETGSTFAENALIKARSVAAVVGLPAVADDSGIEAEALNGAPGIRSARYAGEDASDAENLAKFRLEVPPGSGLRYVCALAYVDTSQGVEQVLEAYCQGCMAEQPKGQCGFGYDPVFLPDDEQSGRTMAELADAEKDLISHRGKALQALVKWLQSS